MNQDEPQKFQLQTRPTKIISVNDALAHDLFSMTASEWGRALDGDEREFLEAKTPKHGVIKSRYWLDLLDDERIKISAPLDERDRSIFDACISEQVNSESATSATRIWRAITGNFNPKSKPTPAAKKEILERVDRLACLRLTIDISQACANKLYRSDVKGTLKTNLLPCDIVEAEINGQLVDVIKFLDESPLLKIARARSGKKKQAAQILTYPVELLDVPNQRKTPTTIAITNYIVRRVRTAKQHSNTARTILFSTMYERCGLADADRWQKQDARKTVEAIMKHLVEKKEIDSFELVQVRGEFVKITFNFSEQSILKISD